VSATDLVGFKTYLAGLDRGTDVGLDVLRHEMGASLNRSRLTRTDEGISAFNTEQLIWAVLGMGDQTAPGHPLVVGLLLSALIDGRADIWDAGERAGLVPAAWTWVAQADAFTGTDADLARLLGTAGELRQRAGAACLVANRRPAAIGPATVALFRHTAFATAYHRLLSAALSGPDAAAVADQELPLLADTLELLFASDVDLTLSRLVRAGSIDPAPVLDRLAGGWDDLTRTAWAERLLSANQPGPALRQIADVRLLSQAWPQAILVAALAHLEAGDLAKAASCAGQIEDEDRRLMVLVRIAQARGDAQVELEHLVTLHERRPADPGVFLQLITLLDRFGRTDVVHGLCLAGQDTFGDHPEVGPILRRILARPA
jgi:hypothetical protein